MDKQMRLQYLVANEGYAFIMDDTIIVLDGEKALFEREREAIKAADRHRLAIDKDGKVSLVNKVFIKGSDVPLTRLQLVREGGKYARISDYPARIAGTLCACGEGQGEFELLPEQENSKRYMRCRKCGEYSHL
jgi:hypothetical protein